MSFHFTKLSPSATFSLCCLILGQFSSFGVIIGAKAKSLATSDKSLPYTHSSTTNIQDSSTNMYNKIDLASPEPTNFTYYSSYSPENDSIESSTESSTDAIGNFSTVNGTTETLTMDDGSILSSLMSSTFDHSTNLSVVEESLDLEGSGSGAELTHANEMVDGLGSGSGDSDEISSDESGSGSGETGFGELLNTVFQGLLNITGIGAIRSNNSSRNEGWTTDSTGIEIQALIFA